ncbi:MAG: secretin and TonB N-terminal domain-containing protein [Proteiniphilum sp.]|nr:secretin and TonB N-terminal domain-containing protein [Proteiniphilum sp.]
MGENMKHMLINKQYLSLILVLIFSLSALLAQANPMTTKVTFNADDATLSSVLNSLARLSGTNIVLAVDQSGDQDKRDEKRVTINVKEVPIETAVSLVARTAGLSYRVVSGNTFVVGTKQNLAEEVGEKSYILYLNNLDAKKVATALQHSGGKIVPLEGQNAIMVYANHETFDQIRTLVQGIDVDQKQIEVRVRLIEINLSNAKKAGIDWSRLNHLTTILAEDPVNGDGTGLPYDYIDETGYLPHGNPIDFETMPETQYFQKINGFDNIGHFSRQLTAFDVTIDWLLENNAAKLLTDTRVTALNGEEAQIHIGEIVPYVVTDHENQVQVEREEAGIIMAVTPTVNKDGNITAKISPEVSSITELVGGYIPRKKVRRVTSTVTVPNEHKIIVGGLLHSTLSQKTNKVPFLGDLPFIGRVFQHRYEVVDNTDLIMEITPRLVSMSETSPEPKLDERLTRTLIEYEDEGEEE